MIGGICASSFGDERSSYIFLISCSSDWFGVLGKQRVTIQEEWRK